MSSKNFVLALVLLILGLCLNAQVVTSPESMAPAYTAIETYQIYLPDGDYEALSTSGANGELNFLQFVLQCIKNEDIVSYNIDDESVWEWSDLSEALLKYTNDGDEDMREYDIEKITNLQFQYVAFYNEDDIAFHRRLIQIVAIANYSDGWGFRGMKPVFLLQNKDGKLMSVLSSEKSKHLSYSSMSYWDVLHSIPSDSCLQFMSYSSLQNASERGSLIISNIPDSNLQISLPDDIGNAIIQIRSVPYNILNFLSFEEVQINHYLAAFNGFDYTPATFREQKNISLFLPGYPAHGYINLFDLILKKLNSGLEFYQYNNKFFSDKIGEVEMDKVFFNIDTIFYPNDYDEFDTVVVKNKVEISEFRVLELVNGDETIPIAVAPVKGELGDFGEFSDENTALCWIPLNGNMQKLLAGQEVYYPGHNAINYLQYFLNHECIGEIIHSRKIDNAEWQEMLKVLQ
ncbi:MAG: hypothetical protein JXR53_15855 [Bacteroidales bacterium]|nr:hypothetical protein [Bacteroidales bacterium]